MATTKVYRPGKTRQDKLPVAKRERVAAAEQRREDIGALQRAGGWWCTDCDLCGDTGMVRDIGGPKACGYCVPRRPGEVK